MKTVMKKMFCLLLVAVMMVGVFPMPAAANGGLWIVLHVDGAQVASGQQADASAVTDEELLNEAQRLYPGHFPENYTYVVERPNDVGVNVYLTTIIRCSHCGETGHTIEAHCTNCGVYGHSVSDHCTSCGEYGHAIADHCTSCGEYGHSVADHCSVCGEVDCNGHNTPSIPSNPSNLICSVCDGAIVERGENKDRFCVACGMYEGDCFCNSNLPTTDDHSGQIQVIVGGDANITIWVNQNVRRMQDVIAQIPMAAPANYEVSWFWDASYTRPIDMNDSVPRRAFHIYVKHSPLYNGPVDELTIQFHLNYGSNKMGDPMMASFDAITGTVLKNVKPTRKYYKFAGWYQDAKCTKPVNWRVKISEYDHNGDDVVHLYAKWEYDESNNKKGEITLMIYLNGNTDSVAKVKDIEGYADDLVVSYGEVVKIVERYYKPISNRDDMDIDGLFTADTWNNGDYSKRNAVSSVDIKGNGDYIIYVMVRDAKAIPSSSNGAKADNSNPKTGDMIMTPVIVLGASATCLAVLFYLNKKRAY